MYFQETRVWPPGRINDHDIETAAAGFRCCQLKQGGRGPAHRTINLGDQLEQYPWQLIPATTLCAGQDEAGFKYSYGHCATHFIKWTAVHHDWILELYIFCWKDRLILGLFNADIPISWVLWRRMYMISFELRIGVCTAGIRVSRDICLRSTCDTWVCLDSQIIGLGTQV